MCGLFARCCLRLEAEDLIMEPKFLSLSGKMPLGFSVAVLLALIFILSTFSPVQAQQTIRRRGERNVRIIPSTFGLAQAQQTVLPASGKVNGKFSFEVFPPGGGPQGRNIYAIEPDGSNKTLIFEGTSNDAEAFYYSTPSYSPDGNKIALVRIHFATDGAEESQICVANADGTNLQRITDTNATINGQQVLNLWPTWSP